MLSRNSGAVICKQKADEVPMERLGTMWTRAETNNFIYTLQYRKRQQVPILNAVAYTRA